MAKIGYGSSTEFQEQWKEKYCVADRNENVLYFLYSENVIEFRPLSGIAKLNIKIISLENEEGKAELISRALRTTNLRTKSLMHNQCYTPIQI
jgi:hypothetical protein